MAIKRSAISDEQIIELYRSGYSQNDIIRNHQVSVQRTRGVLQAAGFDTRNYRTLNDTMKLVITSLVRRGVYYLDIEEATDLSVDAIRDFVTRRMEPMTDRRKTPPERAIPSLKVFPERDALVREFSAGKTFCTIAEECALDEAEIFLLFMSLTDEAVFLHQKALKTIIHADHDNGTSVAMIARKNSISKSIVKKYLKPEVQKEEQETEPQ